MNNQQSNSMNYRTRPVTIKFLITTESIEAVVYELTYPSSQCRPAPTRRQVLEELRQVLQTRGEEGMGRLLAAWRCCSPLSEEVLNTRVVSKQLFPEFY